MEKRKVLIEVKNMGKIERREVEVTFNPTGLRTDQVHEEIKNRIKDTLPYFCTFKIINVIPA